MIINRGTSNNQITYFLCFTFLPETGIELPNAEVSVYYTEYGESVD